MEGDDGIARDSDGRPAARIAAGCGGDDDSSEDVALTAATRTARCQGVDEFGGLWQVVSPSGSPIQ